MTVSQRVSEAMQKIEISPKDRGRLGETARYLHLYLYNKSRFGGGALTWDEMTGLVRDQKLFLPKKLADYLDRMNGNEQDTAQFVEELHHLAFF